MPSVRVVLQSVIGMWSMWVSWTMGMCAVRAAKFVARKQWVVCGADDCFLRVYNYNTMDKVKAFEAHTDYIRCHHQNTRFPILAMLHWLLESHHQTLGGPGQSCDRSALGLHADTMAQLQTSQPPKQSCSCAALLRQCQFCHPCCMDCVPQQHAMKGWLMSVQLHMTASLWC